MSTIRFDVHLFHHVDDPKLDLILSLVRDLKTQGTIQGVRMAKTIAEMKAELEQKLDANLAAVEENTTIDESIVTLLEGVVAQNVDLKQQLLDAIAAGGDASVLQPLIDRLDVQNALLVARNAKTAAAVVANT